MNQGVCQVRDNRHNVRSWKNSRVILATQKTADLKLCQIAAGADLQCGDGDDYFDEDYERRLMADWVKAGVRPWKPSAEELDDACREARQIVEHFNNFAPRQWAGVVIEDHDPLSR
jgi:hypothetical protein